MNTTLFSLPQLSPSFVLTTKVKLIPKAIAELRDLQEKNFAEVGILGLRLMLCQ